ncbi:hypothetical protein WN944_002852 [Citrus x changshan-huyou]|uniref:Uncharacterized protein n=4 Tax=Citrus TaxID=2706 RepID=A0ACB8P6H5_CITSI|nr:protein GLUTAMINE DUMPER 3 [Citrus x clementina]XP_006474135.1 protein GLUTAMINE DUMPER 3 [Citrus sinensis]GAY48434.1 hypothetical protein CUMW_111630 [Citrus unshiu]ESR66686.1 hypothetical protein CICLE_v10009784mg [Citrus x clementina]KAH9654071.1 hypothetical protein KPL70_027621 [Citrus sinensis]KAH9806058.1 hypothetical protein KPL71_002637 [Citrus sinensis]KDO62427.1 hypothetical protein CISIN_1g031677mg [Citrus sinensis]
METARQPSHVVTQNVTRTHSPWHSPVPYLFGGLAAMLGLIAFALLILACSYWKLSGYLDSGDNGAAGERDLEAGEGKHDETQKPHPQVFEEKILVIMAGDLKPTHLATPMSSRSSSFGDDSNKSCSCSDKNNNEKLEVVKQQTANNESPADHQTH